MKIVVLGSTGFVGKAVIASDEIQVLRDDGDLVYHASRTTGQDLMRQDEFTDYLEHITPDVIINCAADIGSVHYVTKKAAEVINNNIQMTLNLYNAVYEACPHAKIINPLGNCAYAGRASIQKEWGLFDGEVHESVFSYGNFKRFLYVISKCYHMQYGIDSVNLIVPNSFGEGDSLDPDKTHAINGMVIRMLKAHKNKDGKFGIWGTGKPIREWIYIRDLASLLAKAIFLEKNTIEPINLAQNKGYSIGESAMMIAEEIGYEGEITFNTEYQDGDPVKIMADTKFKDVFPDYKFYDHREGIRNTVKYYEERL